MSISIVLADDHVVVRQGLRTILAAEPDLRVIAETSDGLETVQTVERLRPDVLVLDLVMHRGGLVCLNSAARFDKWNRAAVR